MLLGLFFELLVLLLVCSIDLLLTLCSQLLDRLSVLTGQIFNLLSTFLLIVSDFVIALFGVGRKLDILFFGDCIKLI